MIGSVPIASTSRQSPFSANSPREVSSATALPDPSCRTPLPWAQRFEYCMPAEVNYGYRVHGNLDPDHELFPLRLIMDSWDEPDYSAEDGKHEPPVVLNASLRASSLKLGHTYNLLKYASASSAPPCDFLHDGR